MQSLNLEPLYEEIRVTDSLAGRSAIAPEILVTLWLEATLDGIGSGRELDRRCQTDIVYLWVLGGVTVNYHTLSDFRVRHGAFLERLLTDSDEGFTRMHGLRIREAFGEKLDKPLGGGLLQWHEGALRLTRRGMDLQNSVLVDLM